MEEFAKKYFDLLTGDYKGINLTRITNFEDFYNKQILDSIEPINQSPAFKKAIAEAGFFIDIGFGGGFPILPLAYCLPEVQFLGVETRNKKVKVVGEIAHRLGLANVTLWHDRIENVLIDRPAVCSLKAVGKVGDFLEKINTEISQITVFFYKGPNFFELEKESIKKALSSWKCIEETEIVVPGTEKRFLAGFVPKKVPHGTKNIKQLVKVTDIS